MYTKGYPQSYIKTMRWTVDAINCYERTCECKGCDMLNIVPKCRMKYAVLDLLEEFGEPDKNSKVYLKAHGLENL